MPIILTIPVHVTLHHHRPQLVYVGYERKFTEGSKPLLTNVLYLRQWWSTVKTALFGASSSLPLLVDRGGRPIWLADEKASLFFCLNNAEIVFSNLILVTLHQYCVPLPFSLALFVVRF